MSYARTSIAALHSTPILPIREKVLEIIEAHGATGCITDDVISYFAGSDKTNTGRITGRFSELVKEGKVVRLGDTRVGVSGKKQLIMRATAHCPTAPAVKPAKAKRTGFLAGMMFAAKIAVKGTDLASVKKELQRELIKASGRKI